LPPGSPSSRRGKAALQTAILFLAVVIFVILSLPLHAFSVNGFQHNPRLSPRSLSVNPCLSVLQSWKSLFSRQEIGRHEARRGQPQSKPNMKDRKSRGARGMIVRGIIRKSFFPFP